VFDILVDGNVVQREEIGLADPPQFYDVEYAIAADVVAGKERVTVRFQAADGSQIATLFALRMIRADAER
jgi:hypothetical protein